MPLPTPTLWMADPSDGTGCTVAVAGSDASATNAVQVRRPGQDGWQTVGTRTGNGAVSVPVGSVEVRQTYQCRVASVLSGEQAVSVPIGLTATASGESVHFRAMCRITERLIALDLSRIGHNVYRQLVEDDKTARFPCVFVCTPEVERVETIDQAHYAVSYPVVVNLADRNDADYDRPLPEYLLWRELILDELMRAVSVDPADDVWRAMPGLREVQRTDVELKAIIRPDATAYQYLDSGLTIWALCHWKRKGAE